MKRSMYLALFLGVLLVIALIWHRASARPRFEDYGKLVSSLLELTAGPEVDAARFDALPREAQALFVATVFDLEIQNGGLCQFFVNCGSPYALRVSESLKMLGLDEINALYEAFLSDNQIDPGALTAFRSETAEAFVAQYERCPFDDFDSAYLRLWDRLGFEQVLLKFANTHAGIFRP